MPQQRRIDALGVELSVHLERLGEVPFGLIQEVHQPRKRAEPEMALRSDDPIHLIARRLEGGAQPADPLAVANGEPPEPPDRPCDPEPQLRVLRLGRPQHRLSEVVQIGVDTSPPQPLIDASHMWLRGLGEAGEVLAVTAPELLGTTMIIEEVTGELPNCLHQPIPGFDPVRVGRNE